MTYTNIFSHSSSFGLWFEDLHFCRTSCIARKVPLTLLLPLKYCFFSYTLNLKNFNNALAVCIFYILRIKQLLLISNISSFSVSYLYFFIFNFVDVGNR
jgi:hypothetical protein